MLVDTKSYELAEHFLEDFRPVPEYLRMQLAEHIQAAVEEWLGWAEDENLIAEAE